ncbi:MAG: MarR family transcriptional regulator [Synergistaceae bacterium]|jgi:DNA-binding MarR family transcriptional regulator|nr:MarR family transcriptional regulator [Synergistaceae bacterium]
MFYSSFLNKGITGTQALVLAFISGFEKDKDIFQRDIEAEFDIRRSSATSILNGLEKHGYIRRESVAYDARLKKLALTDKAIAITEQVIALVSGIDLILQKHIPPDDLKILESMLKQIMKNIEER